MTAEEFVRSIAEDDPPRGLGAPLEALWWDANGDWSRAHALVDELETREGMAVHAYLHRKEGAEGNADYWYRRVGGGAQGRTLDEEWKALMEELVAGR